MVYTVCSTCIYVYSYIRSMYRGTPSCRIAMVETLPPPPDGCISFLLRLTIGIAKVTFKRNMIYPSPRRDVIETKKDTQKGLYFFKFPQSAPVFYLFFYLLHFLPLLRIRKQTARFVISFAANKICRTLCYLFSCKQNRQNTF